MDQLWRQFPTVEPQLKALRHYLLTTVDLKNQPIHIKILDLLKSGGKLLRPGYFYLFSQFGAQQDPAALQAGAAALELLHVGTLIHDDVIDQSPTRRNVPTIQTQYGARNAIYAGDFLFTVYFQEVLKSTSDISLIQEHITSMNRILQGELDQMALNFQEQTSLEAYLAEVAGKTAELFGLACRQGATLAAAPASVIAASRDIGITIGQAYQILDDILDYTGNPKKTQKPVLEDLRAGVYSLPLLLAIPHARRDFHQILKHRAQITDDEITRVRDLVLTYGGIAAAQKVATDLTDQALQQIDALPNTPARTNLMSLTTALLQRDH